MTELEKLKYLKKIKKKKYISRLALKKLIDGHEINELQDDDCYIKYIKILSPRSKVDGCWIDSDSDIFGLSDAGDNFLESHKNFVFTQKLPIYLSIIAIIVSIIALIKAW